MKKVGKPTPHDPDVYIPTPIRYSWYNNGIQKRDAPSSFRERPSRI